MVTATASICDTSSEVLLYNMRGHILAPKAASFDLPDSSYSALSTANWRTGFANRNFGNFERLNRLKQLQKYFECQAIQEGILEESRQLQIEKILLGDISGYSSIIVDTTSETLQQAKIDELECTITNECLKFCESRNFTNTLNDCLDQVKQNFKLVQKIQAELSYFHDDEELDNDPYVEIEVKVNTSRETAENNYDNWLDWFVKKVPDSIRKFFILTIDRA
jgi:hypothetical protein